MGIDAVEEDSGWSGTRWLTLAAVAAALAASVAAGTVLAADTAVTIANFAFDPSTVTVQVGDTVTWTNQDSTGHTATANDGSFNTGLIGNGASATVAFDTAGTFAYHCTIHPVMTGSVVVEAAAATPAPTATSTAAPTARSTARPTVGGGVSITPAPTDTLAATARDQDLESLVVALALAGLGIVMLVGTFVADRRFRRQRNGE